MVTTGFTTDIGTLPMVVAHWLFSSIDPQKGYDSQNPPVPFFHKQTGKTSDTSLSRLNDNHHQSFEQIADHIEQTYIKPYEQTKEVDNANSPATPSASQG
jgi:hypothetical protein